MRKPLFAAIASVSFFALGACTQETRVEDQAPASTAGDHLEQAADIASDRLEEAGDNAQDSVNDATDGNPNTNP